MEKKKTRKINKRKMSKRKISNKLLPTLIILTITSLVCIAILGIVLNKPEEILSEKLDTMTIFDNGKTQQSVYLYSDNNGDNKVIINVQLKKETKSKKVYDLKFYLDKAKLDNKIIEGLEIVVDKGQIKVGQTTIYKKRLKENEIFMTKYKNAKEEIVEACIERQSTDEVITKLKYLDKNDNEIEEKLYLEKNRGLTKVIRKNLNNEDDSFEINLDKTYYKLPENVSWFNLLEDYLAE